jgi:asparagine synthase (glutamine-hydrolysing)
MCGIAGIISKNGEGPGQDLLARLAEALGHRGPDGSGFYRDGAVGFAHTRLAIIDLETGDQPLHHPSGLTLMGNGEIYNYVELRAELADSVAFQTGSDFEPFLHLFARDGLAALDRLRGMYALALYSPAKGETVLARDPFGIKPLYLAETAGHIAFTSEPQALFAAGLASPSVRPRACRELLQLKYTTGPESIFEGIQRVMPGEVVVIREGRIVERFVRPSLHAGETPADTMEAGLAALDRHLEDSVLVHQRADVPYGMFLSGGIDSASLLTVMARLNERPVHTFTCGFPDADWPDERPAARAVAEALGADHSEVTFVEADFWSLLPAIVAALDEPTSDPAILPTYMLAREARKSVKVVLCGEGADEIIGGYLRYRKIKRPWWLGGRKPRAKGIMEGLDILRDEAGDWRHGAEAIRGEAAAQGWPPLQAAQATDIHNWLHADLLLKLDRCLMAHGVEGRTPFLDPDFAAFAFNLPDDLKMSQRFGKFILRQWLAKHCPSSRPFDKKRGFTVPVGQWLSRRARDLGPLLATSPLVAEYCRPEAVRELFAEGIAKSRKHGEAAWSILFFALWHKIHVERRAPGDDLVDLLRA